MEPEKLERRRAFVINSFYFGLIILLIFLTVKYLIPWLLPFIIGFAIAMLFKPAITFLDRRIKLNKKLIAFCVILLGYLLVGLIVFLIGAKLAQALVTVFQRLPDFYQNSLNPAISSVGKWADDLFGRFLKDTPIDSGRLLQTVMTSLQSWIGSISSGGISAITGFVGNLPRYLIAFVFTIMSSVMIGMNYDAIASFLMRQVPPAPRKVLFEAKGVLSGTVLKYIKAYLILMLITFVELTVGFLIIRIENAATVALLIALFDLLPVFGTGGIMIPWILIELVKGNYSLVIGLTVVYIIVTVIRNFIEPKVVGDQLGLHPLVTLVAIYLGFIWMGVTGMIFLPILVQILVSLHHSGALKLWNG